MNHLIKINNEREIKINDEIMNEWYEIVKKF
jgi:hypothetical protein